MKIVQADEFDVAKKRLQPPNLQMMINCLMYCLQTSKLNGFLNLTYDGQIVEEEVITSEQNVILQTTNGVFLKFPLTEIPIKEKSAVGVRSIKLGKDDYLDEVYLIANGDALSMDYKRKNG